MKKYLIALLPPILALTSCATNSPKADLDMRRLGLAEQLEPYTSAMEELALSNVPPDMATFIGILHRRSGTRCAQSSSEDYLCSLTKPDGLRFKLTRVKRAAHIPVIFELRIRSLEFQGIAFETIADSPGWEHVRGDGCALQFWRHAGGTAFHTTIWFNSSQVVNQGCTASLEDINVSVSRAYTNKPLIVH